MIPEKKINEYKVQHQKGFEKLYKGKSLLQLNSPDQNLKQVGVLRDLFGRVLLGGLGLGWIAEHAASKKNVKSVTVIEISQEVIDMVRPFLNMQGKGTIICVDIWDYEPGDFDSAYIDISGDFDKSKMREKLKNIPKVILYGEE